MNNIYRNFAIISIFIFNGLFSNKNEYFKIIGLSVSAAVTYGIVNDSITTRICPEYFTQGFHRKSLEEYGPKWMINQKNPIILSLFWGINATWLKGVLLGIPISLCTRASSLPKLTATDPLKPTIVTMSILTLIGGLAGINSYCNAKKKINTYQKIAKEKGLGTTLVQAKKLVNADLKGKFPNSTRGVPLEKTISWKICRDIHFAGYAGGVLVTLGLCLYILRLRKIR